MDPWLQLLYRALVSPYGIAVRHEDPAVARATFQSKARAHDDPALRHLSYSIRPEHPKVLFIVKPQGGSTAPAS